MLIIDINTCLHDTCIQNDDDVCLQPGCMTLMVIKCLLTVVDISSFSVVFFPYTVKLTFVLDHAPPPLFILLPEK